ncbi:hypothetical protein FANTH_10149 [Fusarium anthophilum]|uniref:Uncharacterized protein n=1 Tax=Fusarium anthophilum TaxID=48485 RepID=A0A8H5DXC6_9HYPO|nr:hypothetical protein FANTH_10149 [Fusarium anthophilum]
MYNDRLNVNSADRYLPHQEFDSLQLISDLAIRPESWVEHVQRYTASTSTALLKLENLQTLEARVFTQLLNRATEKIETGNAYPSSISDMLQDKDADRLDERQIAHNAAHGFGPAMPWSCFQMFRQEPSKNSILSLEKIDFHVGKTEMICLMGTETLSAAVPHSAKEDDVENGRTVCPGFHVAERNLFLAISRILWGPTITPARDSSGAVLPIDPDAVTPGLIVRPQEFKCNITPRSADRKQLIEDFWKESEASLDYQGNYTPNIDSAFAKER